MTKSRQSSNRCKYRRLHKEYQMTILSELVNDVKFIMQFRTKHVRVQKKLDQKAPKAGDIAPDFTLSDVTGKESVTLSDFRVVKPVALVFGSYT